MKKYLMTSVAALAFAATFTSCSNHEDAEYNPEAKVRDTYEATFVNTFGTPDSNHDWGFGSGAKTRSQEREKHNLTAYNIPTLKAGEADHVMNWFRDNDGENSVGLDLNKYFIVYVGGNQKVNCWHHDWDQNYYNNINKAKGIESNFIDVYEQQNNVLDQLKIDGEHIGVWNANGGVTVLVYDRIADNFTAHNSFSSNWTTKWKLARIEYDGEEGWYVGLSAYSKKLEGNGSYETLPGSGIYEDRAYYTDYDREDFYDDYVFKIVPADDVLKFDDRIFVEDLSATNNSDFDFNDVVFDVRYTSESTAQVRIQAAGGTLPITVAGYNVHNLFAEKYPTAGITETTMINTGAGPQVGFVDLPAEVSSSKSSHGADIEIIVTKNGTPYKLEVKRGDPACKFRVSPNVKWQVEYTNINRKYPKFDKWVKNANEIWYAEDGSPVADN